MNKYPLGIAPKYIHDEIRRNELSFAIQRYLGAKLPVPIEWVQEYNNLTASMKKVGEK